MIPTDHPHLKVFTRSHPGMSGKNNEDRFLFSAFRLAAANPVPVLLAIVSDGIGGHLAGEIAADIAVKSICQAVEASDGLQPLNTLRQALLRASQEISTHSQQESEKYGMGATCACCWIIGDRLYTASVGDSRIYLLRDQEIKQISTDHTWVQEAIEAGLITPAQGRNHPNAHILRRYLGSRQPAEPDLRLVLDPGETPLQSEKNQGFQLLPGDQLLLCSDGLTDLVTDQEILHSLKGSDKEKSLEALIGLANQRGGHDNITMICLVMPQSRRRTPLWRRLVTLAMLIVLVLILVLGIDFFLGFLP